MQPLVLGVTTGVLYSLVAVGITLGVLFSGIGNSLAPAAMADVLIYAALITMIAVGRKKAATSPETSTAPAPMPEVSRPTAA